VHFAVSNIRYSIYREKEVSLSQPEKPARSDLDHADLSLPLVDEKIVYVTDLRAVPIDNFAIANVLMSLGKHEVRIAQSRKFRIVGRLLFHWGPSFVRRYQRPARVADHGISRPARRGRTLR
jgi:hypothetical protein